MAVSTNASFADRNPFPDALPLPFEEGVPSPEKVRAMASWLRRHSGRYNYGQIEYVVLYHATGISIPVLEQGLLPTSVTRRRSYQSTSGYVYLAPTPERAKTFGDLGNGGRSRIYAVKVPVKALRADTDQLNNLIPICNQDDFNLFSCLYPPLHPDKGGASRWPGPLQSTTTW